MMISIYRGDDEFVKVPIEYGSKAKKELMTEDSITIKFTSADNHKFFVGDYVNDPRFGYYILTKDYLPTFNENTGGYDYNIKFYAYYYAWNNHFVKLTPKESPELSFSLTDSIDSHVSIILENIKELGFKFNSQDFIIEIGDVSTERKVIFYDNLYIIDAISLIAETFECEWWVIDNRIHFGKCEYPGNFDFKIGDTVSSMTPSESSEEIGTRLYVFGSDKNLPQDYRKTSNEKYAVVQKRLMLPEGTPYLESKKNTGKDSIVEFVKIFDIFPRIDRVATETDESYVNVESDNGIVQEKRYFFKDNRLSFSKEYLLNEELTVRWKTGSLAGMDFKVEFNPYNADENTEKGQWFKVIPNEDYGRLLPDGTLYPQENDEFYLLNWDSSKIAELGLVAKAEQELKEAGEKFLSELETDGNTYTCPMRSHVAKDMYQGNIKSLLDVGDTVTLINDVYFPDEPRKSRIIGYEYNLDYPYDNPVYTVGDKPKYSRLKTLEENVESIVYSGEIAKNFGSGSVYVISRRDSTLPSDRNVYSSLRSQLEFLMKNQEDTAKEIITFEKGIVAKMTSFFERLSSMKYSSGFGGEGFILEQKDGVSYLEVDKLTVRQIMTVFELIIHRIRSVGGQIAVSLADGKIKEVTDNGDSYYITFESENLFQQYDQIRCQAFTGTSVKMYWVEIENSDANGVTVKKSEFNGVEPMLGDECVLDGNTRFSNRQNLILISATDDGKPRIDILDGIKTKSHEGCLRARLGDLSGITDVFFGDNQPKGHGLYSDNAYLKGEFIVKNTGQSVETMFAVQDGKIQSSVASLQNEAINGKTLLYNPSFTKGLEGWITSNTYGALYDDNGLWFSDNNLLIENVSIYNDPLFENVFFLKIKNGGWIKQNDYRFIDKPEFDSAEQYPLHFACNIRCREQGTLLVKVGETTIHEEIIEPSSNFETKNINALWNGEGDFYMSFSGEADFYGITLYTEKTEVRHRTLFEQTDKLVIFSAEKIDDDGNTLNGSEVKVTDEGTFLNVVYQDENNERQEATLGEFKTETDESGNTTTKIKLSGDNIQLVGDVTANGKVHIDAETGTLEAEQAIVKKSQLEEVEIQGATRNAFQNGKFILNSEDTITITTPGLQNNNNVIIEAGSGWGATSTSDMTFRVPVDIKYNGFRATIINDAETIDGRENNTHAIISEEINGLKFYENGVTTSRLRIRPREGVELLGYGYGETFFGWIILNRFWLRERNNGFEQRVMFSGLVNNDGTLGNYRSYNGVELTSKFTGDFNDIYISFEKKISEKYMVILTPQNSFQIMSVYDPTEAGFAVIRRGVNGEVLQKEGGFSFLVINIEDRYNPLKGYDSGWS